MTAENARRELPIWADQKKSSEFRAQSEEKKQPTRIRMTARQEWFLKRYGLAMTAILLLAVYTVGLCVVTGSIVRHNTEAEVTERVTAQMRGEFQQYMVQQEQERMASGLLTGEASLQSTMNAEADAIARAIGPMSTKRQKQTMIWNILVRVDSKTYPNTVQEVIAQPQQWMFYDEKNPIREDDRTLALEQLKLWHEGRYPAGLSTTYVYGEWSQTDYVLRDKWEKDSRTNYWRMPE